MIPSAISLLHEQVQLSEQLWAGGETMFEPQDLPGRYGRVISSVDQILSVMGCASVVAGGWAVWRHGYHGRMTQDIDIILAADRVEEFLQVASVSGFQVLVRKKGRWPKVLHKDTHIQVDVLPEGERPGTSARPAPTTIPHPNTIGAAGSALRYIQLAPLIELKMAAGRGRDESDVIELVRANPDQVDAIREHLSRIHADYLSKFAELAQRAREEDDD